MLKGLKIHEFLTRDHDNVKTALAAVSSKDVAGRADEIELQYWLQVIIPDLRGASQARGLRNRVHAPRFHAAGRELFPGPDPAGPVAPVGPGQKSLLFFSNGIPSSLVNASRGVGDVEPAACRRQFRDHGGLAPAKGSTFQVGNYELRPLEEALFKEFSASDCTIYTFDTRESSKLPALFAFDEMAFMTVRPAAFAPTAAASSATTRRRAWIR